MKRRLKVLILITVLLLVSVQCWACGFLGDPMLDDLWTRNIYPGEAITYDIGSEDYPFRSVTADNITTGNLTVSDNSTFGGGITLEGDGLVWLEVRPDVDFVTVQAHGKPTWVTRGVANGFSLPIYAPNEELFYNVHVPGRWDGASDIMVHVHGWIDTANTDKNFNLQVAWEHVTFTTDVIPTTSHNVNVETGTDTGAQYQTYSVMFTIDYDIDTPDDVNGDDCIYFRVRRIVASANEIAGEFVVCHIGVLFIRDKMGTPAP